MKYGYARVSSDGQSVDAQVRQLTKAGCKKVFREVASGAKTDRAQLRRLLAQLDNGDVLTVTRLDRLARSTRDLLNTLATITGKKAGFRSLGDTWADTTTSHGRLMLTVLGGLAEFERDLVRSRTGEGRARAVARGVKMGRPPKLTPHQQREAIKRRDRGEESLAPSVPMMMRHRPPTSLGLGTGERHRGYAQHRWPNRRGEHCRPSGRPQAENGAATACRVTRTLATAPAPDILGSGQAAHPGGDRPRRRYRRDRRHPAARRPLFVGPDRVAPPTGCRRVRGTQADTAWPQA